MLATAGALVAALGLRLLYELGYQRGWSQCHDQFYGGGYMVKPVLPLGEREMPRGIGHS